LFGLNDGKFVKKLTSTCEIVDPEKGSYDMHAAYKYSKLMDLLFARELAERLKGFFRKKFEINRINYFPPRWVEPLAISLNKLST